jgi:microsomal epoxide hydrolase
VGLAAWIVEKFYSWSDTKGNIENSFSKDELLTNIMIYWVSQTINTSIRRYLEDARAIYAQGGPAPMKRVEAPTALTIFPADSDTPKEWAERRVNLQRYNKMPKGGRFAALEVPELYVQELRDFVGALITGGLIPGGSITGVVK